MADPTQSDKDKYNRLLRYVYLGNALINQQLIAGGYGFEYTYNIPYQFQSQFKQAQKNARDQELGLWSPSACASVYSSKK